MLWIRSGETHLDSAGLLIHMNQMTSAFCNLSFLCANPFSLLLGEWIQNAQILVSMPWNVFQFVIC